jgi:threonine/homoserine/homoserine lactone efflux protein
VARSAAAVAITSIAFMVAFELVRRYVISHSYGANELTNADVRGAVAELWDVYLGDLMTWALGITVVALLIAAAARSMLVPYSPAANLKRLLALARRADSNRARGVRGAIILALGIFAIVRPTLAFEVLAVVGGCVLAYVGVGELLTATAPAGPLVRPASRRPRRRTVAVVALATALIGGVAASFLLTGETAKVRASPISTCNGYPQLCSRRLDEVVFAGTHNSMSAADSPGWLIANQDRTVHQQLQDGIRLFKVSAHYAVEDSAGGVHTDIAASGQRLNRVASKLSPAARLALQRLSRALSAGSLENGKRDIWLCHTLCELGATRMVDFLATIHRFLERNPNQVIILFDEDYVAERDLQSAFKRAGLFRYLETLQPGQPLPTLGALIRSQHNVLVFAQKPTSGNYRWDMDGFEWIQDTPLGAQKPAQFNCRLYRGRPSNPLLMMNDWADTFPPRLTPNLPLVKRAFLLARARQCVAQRGRIPNLILTDYYNRGDVVGAAAELNGVAGVRPAPILPWS